MELIRHCLVCGKEFKACNTCQQNIPETLQWRRVVCCPAHFSYHIPIIMYHNGVYDKEKAKTELQNAIDTYGNIKFCDNVKDIVSDILSENNDVIDENINIIIGNEATEVMVDTEDKISDEKAVIPAKTRKKKFSK